MLTAAALPLVLLAGFACGGDDSTTSSDAGQFLKAVDQTCIENAQQVNEIVAEHGNPRGFEELADYEKARAEAAADQAAAVAELEPPSRLANDYAELVAVLDDYARAYEENAALAKAGDEAAYQASVERRRELGNQQLDVAERLGLMACARQLSPEAEAAVREVTERVLKGADPARSCAEDVTDALRRDVLGSGRRCVRELSALARDGARLEYHYATGIDGVLASANVRFAAAAGKRLKFLVYDFVWDADREAWVMDGIFEPPTPSADVEQNPS